jgi:preprotein translocase subunit SecA
MQAELDVSTGTATVGAPSVAVMAQSPAQPADGDGARASAPAYREQQRRVAARRDAGRPAGDPLFTKKNVDPNAPCPCGSGRKYKKCHGG